MASAETVTVEVAYAGEREQIVQWTEVPSGATLAQAIDRSGLLQRFPEIDLARNAVGVFGRLRDLRDTVAAGDRVEIYRALLADPKEARRRRVVRKKKR
jgi:putative ubiquitin-RnfH superfamily antitoxin RatB of RatAB toxin-antitoxin module